ncbi:MAG TPA: hypothetical protein P5137_08015 [Candidatus Brocadiia bacterium]|nr:hypothetical protein [Candidatus Brocadiia bacterium]
MPNAATDAEVTIPRPETIREQLRAARKEGHKLRMLLRVAERLYAEQPPPREGAGR